MLQHITLAFIIAQETLHKHVNENNVTLLFFVGFFMKYSPKCRTKKLGLFSTILGSFCSGTDIQSQIRPRRIPDQDVSRVSFNINMGS